MADVHDGELIPLKPTFDVVRRGYHRDQVDYRIAELEAELRIVTADREAGATQAAELVRQLELAREELEEACRELARLSAPPETVEGMSARVKRMLRLAQDEAADIVAKAEADAAKCRAEAESEVTALRASYDGLATELQRRRAEMEAEHERVLADTRRRADELVRQATQRAAELSAESAAKHRQAEEDFEITLNARRTAALQALAEQEEQSRAQAQQRFEEAQRRLDEAAEVARRVVSDADQRATARTTKATEEVERLRRLRRKVTDQLVSAQATIGDALGHLEPQTDESEMISR